MLDEIIRFGVQQLGLNSAAHVGIAVSLIAAALYWRKALYVAGKGRSIMSMIIFSGVVVGCLTILGVLDINPGIAQEYLTAALSELIGLLPVMMQ